MYLLASVTEHFLGSAAALADTNNIPSEAREITTLAHFGSLSEIYAHERVQP